MSEFLGVKELLSLLERLRELMRDFAQREEKLEQEYKLRFAQEFRALDTADREHETQREQRLAAAEAEAANEREKWEARFRERKKQVNEAHKRARKQATEAITEMEGRRKYKLQQGAMDAERRRDKELKEASANHEQFKADLAALSQSFAVQQFYANKAFRGFGTFKKRLATDYSGPDLNAQGDEFAIREELKSLEASVTSDLTRFKRKPLILLFHILPLWLWGIISLGFAGAILAMNQMGRSLFPPTAAWAAIGGFVFLIILHQVARSTGSALARNIADSLAKGRRLIDLAHEKTAQRLVDDHARIRAKFENRNRQLDQDYKQVVKEAIGMRDERPREVDEKAARIHARLDQRRNRRLERIASSQATLISQLKTETETVGRTLAERRQVSTEKLNQAREAQWSQLEAEWKAAVQPICERITTAAEKARSLNQPWETMDWTAWTPPERFENAVKFGHLEVDLQKLAETFPKNPRLALPCPGLLNPPLLLTFPEEGSILFETEKGQDELAIASINNILFRLLAAFPPGKVSFTIIDPVGLGQNFAGIMHLADFEAANINSRIWTQATQIEERLAELNEHMEKVIQMYLRNEYQTIAEYNAKAGAIAEKYHFLVVASFPVNFSDTAARRLRNIASSGARCGVYTLVHWDHRHPAPQEFVPDELRANSIDLRATDSGFRFREKVLPASQLALDSPPPPEAATQFLKLVGQSGRDSNRVEVPFSTIAPPEKDIWSVETAEELRVPIGRTGATKLQYLAIGKGTRQHALIAGKTGSGKSTLFHVMITNLALWCSPDQVEFYLVDFKKGVEFKCYGSRRLPHARVVAIESDRQFGLSVLERVDAELRRRGDLFRKMGVQDVAGYKRAGGTESVPRSLLMIDEFQEFFVEEDRISQAAAMLLDRIVRQGRAFGIHVILGSQTLGGAYTLARATLGQMVIRIALQCNEADAYLIMDQDNPAPRLLSRPGEGIYNDEAGAIQGNSPFQAVWLDEDTRDDYLTLVRERADENRYPGPFVFEGNAPADIRENKLLARALQSGDEKTQPPRLWLGTPNSIKGPTEAIFPRQSGSNLLIVGQNEEPTLALFAIGLISLAAQRPRDAEIILLDSYPPGSPHKEFLDQVAQSLPVKILQPRAGDLPEIFGRLAERATGHASEDVAGNGRQTFIFINGLQNFKKLKQEDEFSFSSSEAEEGPNPAKALVTIITEGPANGIHVIASCDTFNNVTRFLGRKLMTEFAMRMLFQMSASDSAALIDAPDAGTLGLNRALIYHEREGYTETFRPYARPENEWLEKAAADLSRAAGALAR